MMAPGPSAHIWIAAGQTDMRRGMQGLSALVQTALAQNPFSGHDFVFRGRRGDLVKILWFDGDGLCLFLSGVEKASKVEQTVDNHGNMTERKQYGFYTPGGSPTLLRTFTYTYLASSDYSSRHIWNRVVTAKVQKPGGSLITLVTNTYDWYPTGINGISGWQQHDDNIYTQFMIYRGNVTRSVSPGKAVNMTYNMGGAVLTTSDDYGHSVTQSPDSGKNYAVPSSITTGSLSTSFSWNGYMAMTGSTAPNSATSSFSYDSYARPSSTTAANGRVTTYTYHTSPNYTVATTGTRWTKTTVDGFGRPLKVESGYNTGSTPTTVAIVDTLNAPCACTPVGKLWKTSLPYAPGGTVYWTETLYDALRRTVQVIQPNGSGTTTYTYSGPTVKVTDPSSSTRWKKYENL